MNERGPPTFPSLALQACVAALRGAVVPSKALQLTGAPEAGRFIARWIGSDFCSAHRRRLKVSVAARIGFAVSWLRRSPGRKATASQAILSVLFFVPTSAAAALPGRGALGPSRDQCQCRGSPLKRTLNATGGDGRSVPVCGQPSWGPSATLSG